MIIVRVNDEYDPEIEYQWEDNYSIVKCYKNGELWHEDVSTHYVRALLHRIVELEDKLGDYVNKLDHNMMQDDKILTKNGWTMCTWHPLEITHDDGSHASGLPAKLLLQSLYDEELENMDCSGTTLWEAYWKIAPFEGGIVHKNSFERFFLDGYKKGYFHSEEDKKDVIEEIKQTIQKAICEEYPIEILTPICEECDIEMHEFACDGKSGWACAECGWSFDDE